MRIKQNEYCQNNITYFDREGVMLPSIESKSKETENIKGLYNLLIDFVFSKDRESCAYDTNENHLIYFNGVKCVTWINTKGYIHFVLLTRKITSEHIRFDKNGNIVNVNDGYYNSVDLIKSSINYISRSNIYKRIS